MKQKILITGAFGLVGSNICKILERDYPEIEITKIKFDELEPHWEDDGKEVLRLDPNRRFISLDEESYDFIIHCAGFGQPAKFLEDKLKTIEINTVTTDELFKYLKPGGKYLFISSSEVYSGAVPPFKETDIGTTTPQHPRASYIEGKRCGEAICMAYGEQGVDVKIARLALAYGPGTKKGDTRVLNQFIEQALTKGKIEMRDLGLAKRTYCYIEDAAALLLKILVEGKHVVYNVGGISEVTIAELAAIIGEITDVPVSFGDTNMSGAPDEVKLDMTHTLKEFHTSFVTLEYGLEQTIAYQKELYGIA